MTQRLRGSPGYFELYLGGTLDGRPLRIRDLASADTLEELNKQGREIVQVQPGLFWLRRQPVIMKKVEIE